MVLLSLFSRPKSKNDDSAILEIYGGMQVSFYPGGLCPLRVLSSFASCVFGVVVVVGVTDFDSRKNHRRVGIKV